MTSRILTLFTRTPLHVGAGADVGAIDQPIVRERHTGLPIIPGSSLKGVLADLWHADTTEFTNADGKTKTTRDLTKDITWLFGSDDASEGNASAGALSFGEARLLAFPIRSAKGSFAWITSPILLARATRDHVPGITSLSGDALKFLSEKDGHQRALFSSDGPLALGENIVLEDYTFTHAGTPPPELEAALAELFPDDTFRDLLKTRLVILSDGMMSHFARTACEVAQHVRINDATGTAEDGGLFNQENVPADTLFYATIHATKARSAAHRESKKDPSLALDALGKRLTSPDVGQTLQIGADATTGLGFCSVKITAPSA